MTFKLGSLLQKLDASGASESCAVLIDSGFAEFAKWSRDDSILLHTKLLFIPYDEKNEAIQLLSIHRPQHIILFISSDLSLELPSIQHMLQLPPVLRLSIYTTMSSDLTDSLEIPNLFPSIEVSIIYCPCHTIQLLPPSDQAVELFTMTSSHIKTVSPLTLHNIGLYHDSGYSTVSNVTAEDIPPEKRLHLKQLAHELAGALLLNQGMDPTGNVFAIGHTSNLIGNTIQPIVAQLLSEAKDTTPCSLLLIDRTEDIYTPATYHPTAPLMQRILCTLSRQTRGQDTFCDVAISMPDAFSPTVVSPQEGTLQHPLSAVSGLPFRLLPSICPPSLGQLAYPNCEPALKNFVSSLYLQSEDATREHLMQLLNMLLQEEHCSPPPSKKRGFGAEVLAYVQALLQCGTDSMGYNADILLRSQNLICLCIAIVESMQRSSEKQLSQCIKEAVVDTPAYEVLMEVEQAMLCRISADWNTMEHVPKEWVDAQADEILRLLTRVGARHVLLLLARFVCLVAPKTNQSSIQMLIHKSSEAVVKHIRETSSTAELRNLKFLSSDLISDIFTCRASKNEGSELNVRLEMELSDLINDSLGILLEISDSDFDLMSLAVQKQKERHKIIKTSKSKEITDPIVTSGLVATTCQEILTAKANGSRDAIDRVKLIDNPLRKLARKGLGMLTQGLGRFGFGGGVATPDEPHLIDAPNLVIFVVGGISCTEIKQIQECFASNRSFNRVIVGSNRILSPDDMVTEIFESYLR